MLCIRGSTLIACGHLYALYRALRVPDPALVACLPLPGALAAWAHPLFEAVKEPVALTSG